MAQKNFVTKTRVVRGKRWYLDYTRFDLQTGTEQRHRKEFDLNDIDDLQVRAAVAERLAKYLDEFLPLRNEPVAPDPPKPVEDQQETVQGAVDMAMLAKMKLPRANSHKSYKSISRTFLEWAKSRSYAHIPISSFTKKHARAFFDWLTARRKYRSATVNNYIINLRALWYEMIGRELCALNPWTAIKPERKQEKLRRIFTPEDRVMVAREIEKTDYWMFRGVLLQFFGYIRPVELARLKFKNFDLERGVVTIEEWAAKKWKKRYVTLPASILHYFKDGRFDRQPGHYYVFGSDGTTIKPAPEPAGDGLMYKRHKKILLSMVAEKRLSNIRGLTWYSWKDTGISIHANRTSMLSTRNQAGHEDMRTTLIYYHTEQVNSEYQAITNDLFEL